MSISECLTCKYSACIYIPSKIVRAKWDESWVCMKNKKRPLAIDPKSTICFGCYEEWAKKEDDTNETND